VATLFQSPNAGRITREMVTRRANHETPWNDGFFTALRGPMLQGVGSHIAPEATAKVSHVRVIRGYRGESRAQQFHEVTRGRA